MNNEDFLSVEFQSELQSAYTNYCNSYIRFISLLRSHKQNNTKNLPESYHLMASPFPPVSFLDDSIFPIMDNQKNDFADKKQEKSESTQANGIDGQATEKEEIFSDDLDCDYLKKRQSCSGDKKDKKVIEIKQNFEEPDPNKPLIEVRSKTNFYINRSCLLHTDITAIRKFLRYKGFPMKTIQSNKNAGYYKSICEEKTCDAEVVVKKHVLLSNPLIAHNHIQQIIIKSNNNLMITDFEKYNNFHINKAPSIFLNKVGHIFFVTKLDVNKQQDNLLEIIVYFFITYQQQKGGKIRKNYNLQW